MDETDIQALLAAAQQAQRAGARDEAARLFGEVLAHAPDHPIALNALGIRALGTAAFDEAADLFAQAAAADPHAPELWMNLARARRAQHDDAAERAALEGALAIDQRHFMALVRLAELFERIGNVAAALERWNGVMAMAHAIEQPTPTLLAMLDHAREFVAAQGERLARRLAADLAPARAAAAPGALRRFDACVDRLLGRRGIYANDCSGLHYPFLPADEFFERRHFPWVADLESHTATIRAEFIALMASDQPGLRPYVAMPPGTPANKWTPLDRSLDWGAIHLWRDGVRDDAVCARVPRTAALIEALPLADIPGRAPTIFFSVLRPHAHLPAHTGVSNVRAIVHLPLIVPPGCGFRVGGETREWREGEAWAFDDTIEHEAWNRSDQPRAILIFDVWNPHIEGGERALLRRLFEATAEGGFGAAAGVGD